MGNINDELNLGHENLIFITRSNVAVYVVNSRLMVLRSRSDNTYGNRDGKIYR